MHGILSVSENDAVVLEEVTFLDQISSFEFLSDSLQRLFSILSIVELVVVAGFQIGNKDALGVEVFIACQDFQGNIKVLHLVVAQSDVNIYGLEFSSFQQ